MRNHDAATKDRASKQSFVRRFAIKDLHGYRDVELSSDFAASVLIAKNGSGKTTLLAALDAFLKTQFSRLKDVEFSEIQCELRGCDGALTLKYADLQEYLRSSPSKEVFAVARRRGVELIKLHKFLIEDYAKTKPFSAYSDIKVFNDIHAALGYNHLDTRKELDKLQLSSLDRVPAIKELTERVQDAVADFEIVYLPTYRRIELSLPEDPSASLYSRPKKPKLAISPSGLLAADIQFGLSDISERLNELNLQIVRESNSGYRRISADIINELIDGSFENAIPDDALLPDEEELKLFFSRLQDGRRMGPFMPVSIPKIDKIYAKDAVPEKSRPFLGFFLSKLAAVIGAAKKLESPVYDFVGSCNKYLLSREPTTELGKDEIEFTGNSDSKILVLDRQTFKLKVKSSIGNLPIPLDSLSSGEKQMVSLFAKLFLYSGKKIVLIDEPELSLSIDWQRNILVDVLNTPLCEQVIAITHSPFIFDNEIDEFAKSLKVRIDYEKLSRIDSVSEGDEGQDVISDD